MEIHTAAVAERVRELRLTPANSGGAAYDTIDRVIQPLIDQHGVDAVIASLAAARHDPDVAEALFWILWTKDRPMTAFWSDEEIVEAALTFFRAFAVGDTGTGYALSPEGHWGWAAVFHHLYGTVDHLTDDEHFRILVLLLNRVPADDGVLWMIGDGPMCNAGADEAYLEKLEQLAATNPNIARAYELLDEEWERSHP